VNTLGLVTVMSSGVIEAESLLDASLGASFGVATAVVDTTIAVIRAVYPPFVNAGNDYNE
jgi:hypothetical protein